MKKNGFLKPQDVSKGSNKKVWWLCEQGHSYTTSTNHRINGNGCPICSGKKVLPGYNDLATAYPEIAKEWDYEKNNTLTPQKVSKKSHKKVWWKCEQRHSYKMQISDKTGGCGCPYCSGQKVLPGYNDLATTHPDIAKEWDREKNGSLTPQNVSKGKNIKVWWKCPMNHSYIATINDRTSGKGCPYCSNKKVLSGYNDLATTYPDITKEWDYERNGSLTPQEVPKGSDKKVWWKCAKEHSWKATIASRTSGNGCPYCSNQKVLPGYNDLATTHPEIAKEWDYGKNRSLTPQDITKGCNKKVWWLCKQGHSYKQSPNVRTYQNCGCPYCSASHGEKTIDKVLNDLNLKYQTQVTFDGLTGIDGGKLKYDFGVYENNKLLFLIEYQGIQHYVKIDFFGGEKQLEKQQFHDDLKREYAKKYLNIPLLEIPYEITEYADIFSLIKDFYDHTFKS